MTIRRLAASALALLVTGCANHPLDCGVGIQHPDCQPGTAGYTDPAKFAKADTPSVSPTA